MIWPAIPPVRRSKLCIINSQVAKTSEISRSASRLLQLAGHMFVWWVYWLLYVCLTFAPLYKRGRLLIGSINKRFMCVWALHNIQKDFSCMGDSIIIVWTSLFVSQHGILITQSLFYGLYLPLVLGTFYLCDIMIIISSRIVATSQMHPTHARKTFPCFDEPAMRAVFYITLIHDRGTVALSNGMEIGQFY